MIVRRILSEENIRYYLSLVQNRKSQQGAAQEEERQR